MWLWAVAIMLGVSTLIITVTRAIKRAIYFGTAPPATEITHESTKFPRDYRDDDTSGMPTQPPPPNDRRDFPRIATFR